MNLTNRLKQELWRRFGTPEHPAEWDGRVYGGGKISQRFWEYFTAVELLDLDAGARILDIGGGSPATGLSFFPRLLASTGLPVAVLDTQFKDGADIPPNVELITGLADKHSLSAALRQFKPTHLSCISVMEHATDEQQHEMVQAIDADFAGGNVVFTLEFHETDRHYEQQMTTRSMSSVFSKFTRFYLSDFERSPVHCENAFRDAYNRRDAVPVKIFGGNDPLWYPVALRFLRMAPG